VPCRGDGDQPSLGRLIAGKADEPIKCYRARLRTVDSGEACQKSGLPGVYVLALPAFHTAQGMFQSPNPSVPDSVDPTVWTTSTMSPLLL
jgi:hypothetical protein